MGAADDDLSVALPLGRARGDHWDVVHVDVEPLALASRVHDVTSGRQVREAERQPAPQVRTVVYRARARPAVRCFS
jgi:hypothetical protein